MQCATCPKLYYVIAYQKVDELDLRIGELMQICIHRKDNLSKPVNHRLTLRGAQGQI